MELFAHRSRATKLIVAILIVVASLTSATDIARSQTKTAQQDLRVLFIGNSLTYSNRLPEMVAALARVAKQKKLSYKTVAYANYSLEDHWNEKEVHKQLKDKKWDYVVMQQGPSASEDGRKLLIDYSKRFAAEVVDSGARPVVFGVWAPRSYRPQMFERTIESYRLAAKEIGGIYVPAARAWRLALDRDPTLRLYSPDDFHPSVQGTYLAALVVFQKLYGKSDVGLTPKLQLGVEGWIELTDKEARLLHLAATDALATSEN
jgi:hypothetical protein